MKPGRQSPPANGAGAETVGKGRPRSRFLLIFLLLGPLFCWLLWLGAYAFLPGPASGPRNADNRVEVLIPRHSGLKKIAEILAAKGVVRDDARFIMLAHLMLVAPRLQAGEYELALGKTPCEVLRTLAAGRVLYRPVTIPEGSDLRRVAAILAADGWVDQERFAALARDALLIKELGLEVNSLEGYLFPETYSLSRGHQDERAIIMMMASKSAEIFETISKKAGRDTGLTRHQILTLASIVEKETAKSEERPLIAGVLLNRYQKGMRLQADPTVIYGLSNFTGNLTRQDLDTPSPYNTYLNDGLPPGPICNPGRAAIEAVVMPADVEYLFFVSMNDGSHYFSETLEEHNQAVHKYQKGRN